MKTLPAVDVLMIGGGWTGLLMAKELGSRTPLRIAVLERGGMRTLSSYRDDMDELEYAVRLHMMQDAAKETVTLRHNMQERALPIRQFGSFLPGTGVGGAGEHWGGLCPRILPDFFELRTRTAERYGAKRIPEEMSIQDWGITYEELEPYYTRAEKLLGVSGKAGNLRGKITAGGNIFEGPRSEEYPTPPTKVPYVSSLFEQATKKLGYHPYPNPAATISETYTNPDGVTRVGCFYCGFCDRFGCMVGAKAQPSNTLLPLVEKLKNVSLRTGATVRRIVHEKTAAGLRVRGVRYIAGGEEYFQPADLVFLCSFTLNNSLLLLLSGIGTPYNPATGKGTVGRNLTHQINIGAAQAFFDQPLNRFMGAAAAGVRISDFDGDVFDHTHLEFLRGGTFGVMGSGFQPIDSFGVLPPSVKATWGAEWKKAAVETYDRRGTVGFAGEHLSYRDHFLDLDPTYKDYLGDPLLRMTLDWRENERKMTEYMTGKGVEMARAMGAKEIIPFRGYGHYNVVRYQSTHVNGGAIMGNSPEHAVVNPYLQHWDAPNFFVLGASSFPQQSSANPTPTVLALTYRTADAIVERYLKHPGPLA